MTKVVAAYDGQKVHVVLDNASVHLSKETEQWLAKQRGAESGSGSMCFDEFGE